MDKEAGYRAMIQMIDSIFRIGVTIYCVNKAGNLNRSKWGWGLFGLFLPIVAVIWIQFMKSKNEEVKNKID